jgi:phosphomannomutase/phosphoglucomutase
MRIVDAAMAHFKQKFPVITLDGVRIEFGDGAWAIIRYSNTSPCLSICMEARSPERLAEVEKVILEHLRTYPEISWEM